MTLEETREALLAFPKKPRASTLRAFHPELYQSVLEHTQGLPPQILFAWRVQMILEERTEAPRCPQCGTPCHWLERRWSTFCSRVCATQAKYGVPYISQLDSVKAKRLMTFQERYGVENISQLASTQERIKQTALTKYGVDHHLKAEPVKSKRVETTQERYGVPNVLLSEEIQAKVRATIQKRYGVDYPQQSEAIRRKTVQVFLRKFGVETPSQDPACKQKAQETLFKNYGVSSPQKSQVIRERTRQTCQERYGSDTVLQVTWIQEKIHRTLVRKYGVHNPFESHQLMGRDWSPELISQLQSPSFWEQKYITEGQTLGQIGRTLGVSATTAANYMHQFAPEIATRESPIAHSNEEGELREFIQGLLPTEKVESLRFKDISTLTTSTHGLDIYIASRKLAFEYNGLYWHSNLAGKEPAYHLEKTLEAERLGVRLIHIWSDDWMFKPEIIKAKLRSILKVPPQKTVFARKCEIKIPTSQERAAFYTQHHIKGDHAGSISYMLRSKQSIVAMITFRATSDPLVYDLVRFAVDSGTLVPGGFSKLLTHFKRNHAWREIFTYADRTWSQGNVYQLAGFELDHVSPPAFYGVESGRRVSRLRFTHSKLAARFPNTYDATKTQLENLVLAKVPIVYDCGNYVFKLHNNS